ncbi:FAD-dependent oxidoreductase [Bryobacter aggregatus]|uniref:FAD-dependent oxidoreductase n=1 Tax=Bryobacter aggregatus TaxID=360054 RepID=UPI0004E11784|nr:FAD-dependent oxidoreductase [Bryobacter aggregatus]
MTRRDALAAPFLQLGRKAKAPVTGSFVLDAFPTGHKLRDHASFPAAAEQKKIPLVIIGAGMAGLSAAWWLKKRGFSDFVILEMEQQAGGNSRYGENEVSAYPWGAHYVPIPNRNSPLVRELFEEMGLIQNGEWNERHLCHSPQERLFIHGRWQFGLEPELGMNAKARREFQRFEEIIQKLHATGHWTIPHALGKIDPVLEAQSFPSWLKANGFESPELFWYLDYSTRDDYGSSLADTSAWAGLHYFAARDHDDKGPFTWPEGNGWVMKYLRSKVQVRPQEPVYKVRSLDRAWQVMTPKASYLAQAVIWAAPSFLASHLVEGAPKADGFTYSPWVTANLTLDRLPKGGDTAWDNVIYGSSSLGYVVATHQDLAVHRERTVWTWYNALAEKSPREARKLMLESTWEYWRDAALHDLSRPHPEIADCVARIDVFRNGHAMVRPTPGFLQSEARKGFLRNQNGMFYAHSDLSGISIFEEAQYRGVEAAKNALRRIGGGARA